MIFGEVKYESNKGAGAIAVADTFIRCQFIPSSEGKLGLHV